MKHRRSPTRAWRAMLLWALLALAVRAAPVSGGDGGGTASPPPPHPVRADELIPNTVLAAVIVPDTAALGHEAVQSRLGKLFQEPAMRDFLKPVGLRMKELYEELQGKQGQLPSVKDLEAGVFSAELAACLYLRPDQAQRPLGVMALLRPRDPKAFARLLTPWLPPKLNVEDQPILLGDDEQGPGLIWTHGRLFFCRPIADAALFIERIKEPAVRKRHALAGEADYRQMRAHFAGENVLFYAKPMAYLEALRQRAKPEQRKQLAAAVRALGLEQVRDVGGGLRFKDGAPLVEGLVRLKDDQAPCPALDLFFARQPLDPEALRIAAPNAPYVTAGRYAFAKLLPLAGAVLEQMKRGGRRLLDETLDDLRKRLNFDPQDDLLANFSGDWVLAQTAVDTSAPPYLSPGMILSLQVKDGEKAARSLRQIIAFLRLDKKEGRLLPGVRLRKFTHRGTKLYYFSSRYLGGGPVVCVKGRRVLVASTLSAMRRGLEQLEREKDVRSNPRFQKLLARMTGRAFDPVRIPASFSYADDRGTGSGLFLFTSLAVYAGTAVMSLAAEYGEPPGTLAREMQAAPANKLGFFDWFATRPGGWIFLRVAETVDLGLWPDQKFFEAYRFPKGALAEHRKDGFYLRWDVPLPTPGLRGGPSLLSTLGALALSSSLSVPLLLKARASYHDFQSLGNLRKIGAGLRRYAKDPKHPGAFPKDLKILFPDFVPDRETFINPANRDQPVSYMYVPGLPPEGAPRIVLFETYPKNAGRTGRNVLYTDGSVGYLSNDAFFQKIDAAKARWKARGKTLRFQPIHHPKHAVPRGPWIRKRK